jgi:UDP-N-acetyl-D-mannosaminuronic acid dehydrogenase
VERDGPGQAGGAMAISFDQKVCVMGLGYVGLPTAAVLASRGYAVRGVDVNPKAVDTINSGKAHIVEPDLDILVRAAVQTDKLECFTEPAEADVFAICVPTPLGEDNQPGLDYVRQATEQICPHLREGNLIILESTSPPGTTEMIADIVQQKTGMTAPQVMFAHAPERVLPGKVLREIVENDRIIGGIDDASTDACAQFYQTFVTGTIHKTTARTAETAKLVENAYRDVNIAFANELSLLSEELKLDVWELIGLANRHPRVNILQPGPGVGGHCIAVDPWFLVAAAPKVTPLIRTAREVNDAKPHWVVERVLQRAERFKKPRVACLGLAYKPDIDDLRESPAVEIVKDLKQRNELELLVVEPYLPEHPDFELTPLEEAVTGADIIVLLVAHRQFRHMPANWLAEKVIIDTCGVLRS